MALCHSPLSQVPLLLSCSPFRPWGLLQVKIPSSHASLSCSLPCPDWISSHERTGVHSSSVVRGRCIPLLPQSLAVQSQEMFPCCSGAVVSTHVLQGVPHCAGEDMTMGGTNLPSTCNSPPGKLVWVSCLKSPFWLQVDNYLRADNYPESCNEAAAR